MRSLWLVEHYLYLPRNESKEKPGATTHKANLLSDRDTPDLEVETCVKKKLNCDLNDEEEIFIYQVLKRIILTCSKPSQHLDKCVSVPFLYRSSCQHGKSSRPLR